MPKKQLTGSGKKGKDTLKDPAMKAMSNPSKGPKTKQGRMFGKKGKKGY